MSFLYLTLIPIMLYSLGYIFFSIYSINADVRKIYDPVVVFVEYHDGITQSDYPWVSKAVDILSQYVDISITDNPASANVCIVVSPHQTEPLFLPVLQPQVDAWLGYQVTYPLPVPIGYNCSAFHGIRIKPSSRPLNVSLHELLHVLGLSHSNQSQDVIYPASITNTLSPNDIRRLQALYP